MAGGRDREKKTGTKIATALMLHSMRRGKWQNGYSEEKQKKSTKIKIGELRMDK